MTDFDTTPLSKEFVEIGGKKMAYHEIGEDDPVLSLHGIPTSSYLWRNIIPHAAKKARCIAPDFIGMGDSDKLDATGPDSYRFIHHRHYLNGLLDALELVDHVTFVIHDWGSVLGFEWSNRNRDRIAGIAYMEAIARPVTWEEWPEAATPIFQAFRSPAREEMVIEKILFVEAVLPGTILRKLSDDKLAEYRCPFSEAEHRRPTLTWPREISI